MLCLVLWWYLPLLAILFGAMVVHALTMLLSVAVGYLLLLAVPLKADPVTRLIQNVIVSRMNYYENTTHSTPTCAAEL